MVWFGLFLITFLVLIQPSICLDKLYSVDPEQLLSGASDVWFESLSEEELKAHYSQYDGTPFSTKVDELREFEITTFVDIVLVGFDGTGNMALNIVENELSRYFRDHNNRESVHVLRSSRHVQPLTVRHVYRVTRAKRALLDELESAIHGKVAEHYDIHAATYGHQKDDMYETVSLSVSTTDDVIRKHFQTDALSYSIYLLNPTLPTHAATNVASTDVDTDADESTYQGKDVPYVYNHPDCLDCPLVQWSGTERYAWIDLSAASVSFGPVLGEGGVSMYTVPRLKTIFQHNSVKGQPPVRVTDATLVENFESKYEKLLAEMAAYSISTVHALISPPIDRFPQKYTQKLLVNLVYIHENSSRQASFWSQEWYDEQVQVHAEQNMHLEAQLQSLLLVGQTLTMTEYHVQFSDADNVFLSAYTHALRYRASSSQTATMYLDSAVMQDWLEHASGTADWGAYPPHPQPVASDNARVLNVYVFDLDEVTLLDGTDRAVAFDDMVIAVQASGADYVTSDTAFTCQQRTMQRIMTDSSRAVLAATLQAMWGVAPSHERWNQPAQRIQADYRWATGLTPFGPFSDSQTLSFSLQDAAKRHVVYSELVESVSQLRVLAQHLIKYDRNVHDVLTPEQHLEFIRRVNVFEFKLSKCVHFLSVNNFDYSLYFILSAHHDVNALHQLVHDSFGTLIPVLSCAGDDKGAWLEMPSLFTVKATLLFALPFVLAAILLRGPSKSQTRARGFHLKRNPKWY